VRALWVLAVLGLGCGTAAPPPTAPSAAGPEKPAGPAGPGEPSASEAIHGPKPPPVSPEAQAQLDRALSVGRAIYLQDVMSAWGTDVLREHVPGMDGVGGYLTLQEGNDDGTLKGTWLVQFFSREPTPRVLYRIRLWKDRSQQPAFEKVNPPTPLTASEQVIVSARQAAIRAIPPPRQPINPVVLPAQILGRGQKGAVVYLLAGTNRPGIFVLGQHHRVLVGEDGQVQKVEPLSKSSIEIPSPPPGTTPAGLVLSHIISDYPLETHVFAALLYRQELYIVTRTGRWHVTGKKIVLMDGKGL
jgi:hypothetical protein